MTETEKRLAEKWRDEALQTLKWDDLENRLDGIETRENQMNNDNIKNARIKKVSITMEDHGLMFFITLDGGGWGVNVGGYCIGNGYLGADKFSAENGSGLVAMMRIMDVVGVSRWEDLEGKYVRVKDALCGSIITTIGNIIEDKWFDMKDFFTNYAKEER